MKANNLASVLEQYDNLKTDRIIKAFREVDRLDFIPVALADQAYIDYPLPLGYGSTISQPSTVAFMLEELEPKAGDKILEVGSGSGWVTTLLAKIVGSRGKVFGVEIIPELIATSRRHLERYEVDWAKILKATTIGYPEEAPYDRIIVSAAADTLPKELVLQLKKGGKMIVPVGNVIVLIDKQDENTLNKTEFPGYTFVPLRPI